MIDNIINLFFDYVYPLTPCLHRPTFIANLTARMDKTDPIFFALTLNVIASTLVQVPRSLVNLEKSEVESLARRCVRVAKAKINFVWEVRHHGRTAVSDILQRRILCPYKAPSWSSHTWRVSYTSCSATIQHMSWRLLRPISWPSP